ncbi:MAG: hypothetical protein WC565_00550 [Parcubacteria group bacterium]
MLIGREREKEIIDRLKNKNLLTGSFLFFGEPQVGKFSFADILTRELEGNPSVPQERLIITAGETKIGIDKIREMRRFLRERPVMSEFRSVIVESADKMTPEAQNAALKIVEEPPTHALIIFIASGSENLLPTLASRLRKLYFPQVKNEEIVSLLVSEGISSVKAAQIVQRSFGRPGFALELASEKKSKSKKDVPQKFASSEEFETFMKMRLAGLYNDNMEKNAALLKKILKRMVSTLRFNTNKRLQLSAIPWTR